MVLKNIEILREIINLGREITKLRDTKDGIDKQKLYESREKQMDLMKYLEKQDKEVLQEVITVMYIGIDKDYDENDTPEQIFNIENLFLSSQGWPEKDILVYIISNKSLLDEFLLDGMKALRIEDKAV